MQPSRWAEAPYEDCAIAQPIARAPLSQQPMSSPTANPVDPRAFLADLTTTLQQPMPPGGRISFSVEATTALLPAAAARLLRMLVQALVVNAACHAFGPGGGHIAIRLSRSGPRTCCSVRDHGMGLRGIDPLARGLGMTRAQLLAQQVCASCTWHVHPDGTEAVIIVDDDAPAHQCERPA
jgi:two-component sensor histidine kinase